MAYLKEKGYIQYEISNYCISGYESRHNSKYWDFSQYIGFGPGAHSFVGNRRYSNNMSIPDYLNSGRFVYDEISVSINNKIAEFIMTSLRRIKGFTDKEFITATGLSIPGEILSGICSMEQEGLMHVYNGRYCLSEKGLFIADRIIFRLVENYL
jgi:oxygen-independent coproporphyrinogen-3 oxidase